VNVFLIIIVVYIHCVSSLMFLANKIKKGNKAFSYLFRIHLVIAVSAMVTGCLGAMSRMEFFFIKHELHVNG